MKRRIGKFYIHSLLINDSPEAIKKVMGKCIILRCEHLPHRDAFEYIAISDDFDEIAVSLVTPEYQVVFNSIEDIVTFKKVTNDPT